MKYGLYDYNNPIAGIKLIRTFPSYADAVAHAKILYSIVVFSRDRDVDYYAADFLTKEGNQYAIEPIREPGE